MNRRMESDGVQQLLLVITTSKKLCPFWKTVDLFLAKLLFEMLTTFQTSFAFPIFFSPSKLLWLRRCKICVTGGDVSGSIKLPSNRRSPIPAGTRFIFFLPIILKQIKPKSNLLFSCHSVEVITGLCPLPPKLFKWFSGTSISMRFESTK